MLPDLFITNHVVTRYRYVVVTVCRDAELSSSVADVLHCLDVVSELSSGFDTTSSVSSGSHSALYRTGKSIFFVAVYILCSFLTARCYLIGKSVLCCMFIKICGSHDHQICCRNMVRNCSQVPLTKRPVQTKRLQFGSVLFMANAVRK